MSAANADDGGTTAAEALMPATAMATAASSSFTCRWRDGRGAVEVLAVPAVVAEAVVVRTVESFVGEGVS
jgi:hypothetical protein